MTNKLLFLGADFSSFLNYLWRFPYSITVFFFFDSSFFLFCFVRDCCCRFPSPPTFSPPDRPTSLPYSLRSSSRARACVLMPIPVRLVLSTSRRYLFASAIHIPIPHPTPNELISSHPSILLFPSSRLSDPEPPYRTFCRWLYCVMTIHDYLPHIPTSPISYPSLILSPIPYLTLPCLCLSVLRTSLRNK